MSRAGAVLIALGSGVLLSSCAPRLRPLSGEPAPRALPRAELPRGHHRVVFDWALEDPDLAARGEGIARSAGPDSVRLDFFLAGGVGSGAAILIGTELHLPPGAQQLVRRVVPPVPLLWAALGRLVVPPARDTTARVDGDTLRADIGVPVAWRVTFVRDSLRRLERVDGGRVVEWVERGARIRYRSELDRRQLDLTITRVDSTGAFDQSIWFF